MRGSFLVALMCRRPGSRKPQVLPLPVLAMDTRSRPCIAMDQDCAWIGVGFWYPALLICTKTVRVNKVLHRAMHASARLRSILTSFGEIM